MIRIIVPAVAGGPIDVTALLAAEILREKLGQPIVVDHHPGAGGALGVREAAKAAADGYTLLAAGSSHLAVAPAFSASAVYDATRLRGGRTIHAGIPDPGGASLGAVDIRA